MSSTGSHDDNSIGEPVRADDLPKRCFVSASYRDTAAVKKLRRSLRDDVEVITFPRAEPDPGQAVSNEILPTILGCSGLIYLAGGASAGSFWVRFERDYALRAGREVFGYTPSTGTFRSDHSQPMPLGLTVMFHMNDEEPVRRLIRWMARERHFAIDENSIRSTLGGFTGAILADMQQLLFRGGPILWLMGRGNVRIAQAFKSEEFVDYLLHPDNDGLEDEWRYFLEEEHAGDEDWYYDGQYKYRDAFGGSYSKRDFVYDLYGNVREVYARVDPKLPSDWVPLPWRAPEIAAEGRSVCVDQVIDLYEGTGGYSFNWNRVDDLIIALYQVLSNGSGPQVGFHLRD